MGGGGLVAESQRPFSDSTNHEEDNFIFTKVLKHSRQHDKQHARQDREMIQMKRKADVGILQKNNEGRKSKSDESTLYYF